MSIKDENEKQDDEKDEKGGESDAPHFLFFLSIVKEQELMILPQ